MSHRDAGILLTFFAAARLYSLAAQAAIVIAPGVALGLGRADK
jgi:hypothetical protein